jgi:N-acetylglutamate synthase-like GNAT family acetyltransferase
MQRTEPAGKLLAIRACGSLSARPVIGIRLSRHDMAPTASIVVRVATLADLPFVSRDSQVPSERVSRMIADGHVYLATWGTEPAGYARIEYLWSKIPYLGLIWVPEQYRRRGVGRSLLAAIERDARAAGHEFFYSSSQTDEPEPQAWHRRMGFTECGFIAGINGDGVGEVFFRKPLGEAEVAG